MSLNNNLYRNSKWTLYDDLYRNSNRILLYSNESKYRPCLNEFCDQLLSNNISSKIKKVIFNPPATIIVWTDKTKTVVKCENEKFDPEKGFAMALAKHALGNKGNYYETFKKWIPKEVKSDD